MQPIPEFLPSRESFDVSKLRAAKRPYADLVWKAAEAGKLDQETFHSLAAFVRMPYEISKHPESERLFFDILEQFWPLHPNRPMVRPEEADFLRSMSEWEVVCATTREKVEMVRWQILNVAEPCLKEVMARVYLGVDAVLSDGKYLPDLRKVPAEAFGLVREGPLWCAWAATRRDERGNYDADRLHHSQDSAIRNALWKYGHYCP